MGVYVVLMMGWRGDRAEVDEGLDIQIQQKFSYKVHILVDGMSESGGNMVGWLIME